MRKYIFLFFICPFLLSAQEIDKEALESEFNILLMNFRNFETIGYKGFIFKDNSWVIDFSQGAILQTDRALDFTIIGNGFFKIILSDGRTAYTRAGEFTIDMETNKLKTIDGQFLYDTIMIPPGFTTIEIDEENKIIALYPDNSIIICGTIYIYELNPSEVFIDQIPNRISEEMFSESFWNLIDRTGGMLGSIRSNGRNEDSIYFYRRNSERTNASIVLNNFLESSNVKFISTYSRLFEIMGF